MWIIRFDKLKPKDYNSLQRIFKKSGFITRRISPIVYGKSLVVHFLQKRSLRRVAKEYQISHIALHKFIIFIKKKIEFEKIFHVFLKSGSIVFIGDKTYFSRDDLDNSSKIYSLTEQTLKSIVKKEKEN